MIGALIRFGGLAGLGWILDFCILMYLVGALHLAPPIANLISSSIAALSVFVISRRFIFNAAEGGLLTRIIIYLAYTLCVILGASFLMKLVVVGLQASLSHYTRLTVPDAIVAAIAKMIITPPQLVLNFFASRHVSERAMRKITDV